MEPTKFENHLRETLKGSKIRPSEDAWVKIKGQISQDFKPKRTAYIRYGIAVSFIGMLVLSVLYFTIDDATLNQEVQVASKPSSPVIGIEKEDLLKATILEEESLMIGDKESYEAVEKKSITVSKKESQRELNITEDAQLANTDGIQNRPLEDTNEQIDTKIAEVLAIVTTLEENNKELTDMEVDSLLRQAQKEILTEKLINSDNSVNPATLLSQVEEELNQSFRDQIFEKLKSGYNKVRTAVADRNN